MNPPSAKPAVPLPVSERALPVKLDLSSNGFDIIVPNYGTAFIDYPPGLNGPDIDALGSALVERYNQHERLVEALRKADSLLAFFYGAFRPQLKPDDCARLTKALTANRAALAGKEGAS